VDTFALKVVVTPALIGIASLAGRRWGEGVGGWLVGLPFTSGPVVLFLALDHGASFAALSAWGSLAGTIAQAAFCLVYGLVGRRRHWLIALAAGSLGFVAASLALRRAELPLPLLLVGVIASLALTLWLLPELSGAAGPAPRPRGDLPARMALATALVLGLTAMAPALGPRWSGILATFPVYAGLLAVFAHRLQGPSAARRVLRGLLYGLFAFAGFFVVIAVMIERSGTAPAFAAAILVALTIHAVSFRAVAPPSRSSAE